MFYFLTATIYRCIIIGCGVLYPAFYSYKSLNYRDGYEQVRWMMYWIVFAAFTACEVVTDLFFSWLPLYFEAKIAFVFWLVLPITRGSSYLYRKIIHPNLLKHESEIDRYIAKASNKGCEVLLEFGQHGMNIAASAVLRTADHLKRSYSVGDVSNVASHSSQGTVTLDPSFNLANSKLLEINDKSSCVPNNTNKERSTRMKRSAKTSKQVTIDNQNNEKNKPSTRANDTATAVPHRVKKILHKNDAE